MSRVGRCRAISQAHPLTGPQLRLLALVDTGHIVCARLDTGRFVTLLPAGHEKTWQGVIARMGLVRVNLADPPKCRRWELTPVGRRELDNYTAKDVTTA